MEKIIREIRLFWTRNGKLLFQIIGVIAIIIFIIQGLNQMAIEQNAKKESNNILTEEDKIEVQKNEQLENKEIEYISEFINYCNQGKIEEAYSMISDNIKNEKYNTIEKFEKEYVKKVFEIKICNYEILKKDKVYLVTLTQDILVTGTTSSYKEEKYMLEGILERKIYICN